MYFQEDKSLITFLDIGKKKIPLLKKYYQLSIYLKNLNKISINFFHHLKNQRYLDLLY